MSNNLTGKCPAGNSWRQNKPRAAWDRIFGRLVRSPSGRRRLGPAIRRGGFQKSRIGALSISTTPDQCSAPWVARGRLGFLPGLAAAATDPSVQIPVAGLRRRQ